MLRHVEAMSVSSRGTGAEPKDLPVQPVHRPRVAVHQPPQPAQPVQLGSAGPPARPDLRERLGQPALPDLLEQWDLPGRKARPAHRVPLAQPDLPGRRDPRGPGQLRSQR